MTIQTRKPLHKTILFPIMFLIILLIQQANGQSFEINPIQSKNGYLIFTTGTKNLPINYEYHYLTVNLTKMEDSYNNLIKQAKEFETLTQIQYLTEKLKREMNGIRLAKRNKRGLFNFVRTFYKYVFGTLNQEDKVELETKINNLSENSVQAIEINQVIDAVNKGIEVINTLNLINEEKKNYI